MAEKRLLSETARVLEKPEQLDMLDALDEAEGLDPWMDFLPCPPWADDEPSSNGGERDA